MNKKQIQKINIYISEKKKEKPFSDYVNEFHLRYAEQQLENLPLMIADKLSIIDNILQYLKETESAELGT